MAEQIRDYFDILNELFLSKDAALAKYAKVRFTQYEMGLWWNYGLPLYEVASKAKRYFGERFLETGGRIDEADGDAVKKAFERLDYAVGKNEHGKFTGCHGRCLRLVDELNKALEKDGLTTIGNPEAFLDYLTFNYTVQTDYKGDPVMEPGYSFEIRSFHNEENRKEFCHIIRLLKSSGRKMSMQSIYRLNAFMKKHSKAAK